MKSPFDQNPEQEAEQQYERNLSRNYAPSERAEIRRSDQRASYNEAVLKQRAESAGANAEIARSKLGVMEQRLGLADIQSQIAKEKAELTQNDLKVKAARELKVISDANGFLRDAVGMDPSRPSFDTQYQKMLAGYPDAAESKSVKEWIDYHVPISKARRETEALIAKEARDKAAADEEYIKNRNRQVLENTAAGELAKGIGLIPTGIRDGKVVFGDEKPMDTGTRTVTTSPGGLETISEKRPITPATAPAAPAAPVAPAAPAAPKNPLADIVSAGGKIKKVGDNYNAFDKDGKFIGTYSLGK